MRDKTIISFIVSLIIILSNVSAVDLSDFPQMFIHNGEVDTLVVIGKAAKAEDVLGAIDIVVMLQNEIGNEKLDIARLDSEVNTLSDQNVIVVGGPCANSAAAKLMGYPKNCLEGFELGKAMIKLYEFDNGNIAMLVAGTVALDTRRATYVLSNYKDFDLKGTEETITGINLKDVIVKSVN